MSYRIREMDAERKFSAYVNMGAVTQVMPQQVIENALRQAGRETCRERKLNLVLVVWILIGMYLYAQCGLERVLQRLLQGLQLLGVLGMGSADAQLALPGRSALSYRRKQVGVRAMALLCRAVCRPLATPDTAGAFRFGMRLMALDGTVDAVADTPANVAAFGRAKNSRAVSAYPQVRGVHLVECGTHAIVDASFWPYRVGERRGANRLLRAVMPDWLLMWDAGLHSFDLLDAVVARGSQVLARLPAGVKVTCISHAGSNIARWLLAGGCASG
jgi:Insertion element 4 transposase N-terminal